MKAPEQFLSFNEFPIMPSLIIRDVNKEKSHENQTKLSGLILAVRHHQATYCCQFIMNRCERFRGQAGATAWALYQSCRTEQEGGPWLRAISSLQKHVRHCRRRHNQNAELQRRRHSPNWGQYHEHQSSSCVNMNFSLIRAHQRDANQTHPSQLTVRY